MVDHIERQPIPEHQRDICTVLGEYSTSGWRLRHAMSERDEAEKSTSRHLKMSLLELHSASQVYLLVRLHLPRKGRF